MTPLGRPIAQTPEDVAGRRTPARQLFGGVSTNQTYQSTASASSAGAAQTNQGNQQSLEPRISYLKQVAKETTVHIPLLRNLHKNYRKQKLLVQLFVCVVSCSYEWTVSVCLYHLDYTLTLGVEKSTATSSLFIYASFYQDLSRINSLFDLLFVFSFSFGQVLRFYLPRS